MQDSNWKTTKAKENWGFDSSLQHWLSKYKALSSNHRTTKKREIYCHLKYSKCYFLITNQCTRLSKISCLIFYNMVILGSINTALLTFRILLKNPHGVLSSTHFIWIVTQDILFFSFFLWLFTVVCWGVWKQLFKCYLQMKILNQR
jgi:hypothetical protein